MPSSSSPTERLNTVEPRLAAVEKALGVWQETPDVSLPMRWWKSISAHPVTSSVVTVLVFAIGIATTQVKGCFTDAVDRRIDNTLKERNGVIERLDKLQATAEETNTTLKTLQPFIQNLVLHQFDAVSKLAPQALELRLPVVTDMLVVATNQDIQVPPQTSEMFRKNLLQVPNSAAGYWPAAAQFVSYRSIPANLPAELPACGLNGNVPKVIVTGGPKTDDMVATTYYEKCILDLDKMYGQDTSTPKATISSDGDGRAITHSRLHLANVTVHYKGAPLVHFDQITFDNCTFDFRIIQPVTSPFGQSMIQQLLAVTNISSAEVNGG